MEIAKMVGLNLKQARVDKHITQAEIANKLGIFREAYGRYERGVIQLNYEQILTLCKLLDITPNDLFGFDDI